MVLAERPKRRLVERDQVTQRVAGVDEGILEAADEDAPKGCFDGRRVRLERVGDGTDGLARLDERAAVVVHFDETTLEE